MMLSPLHDDALAMIAGRAFDAIRALSPDNAGVSRRRSPIPRPEPSTGWRISPGNTGCASRKMPDATYCFACPNMLRQRAGC